MGASTLYFLDDLDSVGITTALKDSNDPPLAGHCYSCSKYYTCPKLIKKKDNEICSDWARDFNIYPEKNETD